MFAITFLLLSASAAAMAVAAMFFRRWPGFLFWVVLELVAALLATAVAQWAFGCRAVTNGWYLLAIAVSCLALANGFVIFVFQRWGRKDTLAEHWDRLWRQCVRDSFRLRLNLGSGPSGAAGQGGGCVGPTKADRPMPNAGDGSDAAE